ncbi:hypothetical protein UFOVP1566_11 [uncultured Caudovirales phage]|uniref:Uncharacterized protein n=1 Tax=uncultured Caudovirales phage TaxID=2100421 RepID=A0A6J7XEM9_9CAUD|nr:hypothetical protein UFOVP1389_29 [uncultured Caudovirales phage]CAB5229671.1 hypothetical protein UFOVP1566_11 [uncultured Caudovirales phage]
MASIVLTNASITVNAVDLSAHANSVTVNYEIDSVEATTFGSTGHTFVGGLQNVSCEIEFMQDFAATKVEATIFPLVGTQTTVVIKPTSSAVSATNPSYTLSNTYLASHTPVAASVGEMAMTSLSFTGGSLAKATA